MSEASYGEYLYNRPSIAEMLQKKEKTKEEKNSRNQAKRARKKQTGK